jgi:hypothetical protein
MVTWKCSDHVRCACKDPDRKLQGQDCPQLWRRDGSWNSRHGSAGFAGRVPTSEGVKQLRKFGYPSRKAAQDAADHVGKLLNLATSEADSKRIGDMVRAVRRGAPLPTVEDVRRRLGLGLLRHAAGRAQRVQTAAQDHWNPCEGVELERPDTAERQRWTPAEAAKFIDATGR